MFEQALSESTKVILNYGILGVFCLFLIILLYILWKHLQSREEVYSQRTDKFIEVTERYIKIEAEQTIVLRNLEQLILSKLS